MTAALIAAAGAAFITLILTTAAAFLSGEPRVSLVFKDEKLHIKTRGNMFMKLCRADVTVTNLYTGETAKLSDLRFDSRTGAEISVVGFGCGVLRAELSRLCLRCPFSPIRRRSERRVHAEMLVMPAEKRPTAPLTKLTEAGDPDSFTGGVRDYRRGERLADVHMKLSAKTGHYMIRERLPESGALTLGFACEEDCAEENAAALLGAVRECIDGGIPCGVISGGLRRDVSREEDVEPLFYALFTECGARLPEGCDLIVTRGEVTA